ncbi:MAG: polyphosphate kinase 1 [Cryomorphaceae bacterium]|nr:polyphosphate kinase 1 [Cryomorphaceae bacterium]MBT6317986.1 polyphosphate kinase 1 [Cryomorphaceae bacterium]MBT6935655.1 polyphosphate kinase 1 [Cryomorphaceae bacterium]
MEPKYINRELSWLDFNARVLQEASNKEVPILERLRFIGIFSNNLDEFFQVRYATVKRIADAKPSIKNNKDNIAAKQLLDKITSKVISLQSESSLILESIEKSLKKENIVFINEKEVPESHKEFLKDYFIQKISPALVTVILSNNKLHDFKDNKAFLITNIKLIEKDNIYALVEIPRDISRFVVLPKKNDRQYIMLIDDIIRYHLDIIFSFFNYSHIEANMLKITRDAEFDIDDIDISKSYIKKIQEYVNKRKISNPVRLVYDKNISSSTLKYLIKKIKITSYDSLIPGGKYHHRSDYMNFPDLGRSDLLYPKEKSLDIKDLKIESNLLDQIEEKDFLMYTPYHSFSYLVSVLKQSAIDPTVKSIKITLYRLSKKSNVISSLINAAKNGKKVLVQIELQARFDEENNIKVSQQLKAAGVDIMFGVKCLKVHSKICLIERFKGNKKRYYGFVSTGNFNESTAKIYSDFTLFTSNQKILKEVHKVFDFLKANYKIYDYKHLIVSPHQTSNKLLELIDNEILNVKKGLKGHIILKLNSFTSYKFVDKLYEASKSGVKIKLLIRGICCLIPDKIGLSENIEVKSVVDKYLEHSRVYVFENAGDMKIYISSADLMTRNIEKRVEVACPIYQDDLKNQILETLYINDNDNVKSRLINHNSQNEFIINSKKIIRSQLDTYSYFKNNLD